MKQFEAIQRAKQQQKYSIQFNYDSFILLSHSRIPGITTFVDIIQCLQQQQQLRADKRECLYRSAPISVSL